MDGPIGIKGVQTPDAVVDEALGAVAKHRLRVTSGIGNKIGAVLGSIFPDRIVTRVIASKLRPKYQPK
jgi:hypothetical protein